MSFTNRNLDLALRSIVDTLQDTRSKLLYKILIETSCKTSELSKIKISDVYSNKIKFSNRKVSISKELIKQIRKYVKEQKLSPNAYLFSTRQSDSITPKRIRQIIHATSQELADFKISPKDIRKYSIQNKLKTKTIKEVKNESGLKRLDRREYLSKEQLLELKNNITDKRTSLLFKLLLRNIKPSQIANFKVEDIISLPVSRKLVDELENYAISKGISFGEYLFQTRKDSHISKRMIFKIISNLGNTSGIKINPQFLNNTALANALVSKNSKNKMNNLGIKTQAFHLHGGFFKNE